MPSNQNVEERIVEMQIDNKKFESGANKTINLLEKLEKALNIKGSTDAFDSINAAVERFNPNPIINGLDKIIETGGVAGTAVKRLVENLTDGLYNGVTKTLKDLTLGQVESGFSKYEQLAQSVQMIASATRDQVGENLRWADEAAQMADINAQLEKMLWYTDETSYSFSDGADNIGKFLSAGVDFEDAFSAIMGVMTLGGASGAKVQEVSRALYNISQAMGTGSMKTIDWKSIETANLATLEFKQNVIETAAEMGVLTKVMYENDVDTEGFLPSIDKDRLDDAGYIQNLTEKEIDSIINAKNFRESLSSGWFTDEVMTEVFKKYGAFSDALYDAHQKTKMEASDLLDALDAYRNGLNLQEYADDAGIQLDTLEAVVKRLDEVGIEYSETGFRLGQEAKTWSDALDATRDAVSSRWMQTFKLVFGDYLQAKKFWTDITGELFDIFAAGGDIRNKVLEAWNQTDEDGFTGRDFILGKRINAEGEEIQGAFWDILDAIHSFVDPIKDAFAEVFGLRPGDLESTGHALRDLSKRIKEFTQNLGFSEEAQKGIKNMFTVLFTVVKMAANVFGAAIPIVAHLAAAIGEIIDAFIRLTAGQVDVTGFCKATSAAFKSILPSADNLKDGLKGLGKFFWGLLPNEEQIVGFFSNLGTVIQNALESMKQFFKTKTLSDLLPTTEQIEEFLDKVADFLEEKFPSLANWIRTLKESEFISNFLTNLVSKIDEGTSSFTKFFSKFSFNSEEFKKKFESLSNFATAVFTALFGDPKELKAKIDTFIQTLWQSINDAASKLTFKDVVNAIRLAGFGGFVASVISAVNKFKDLERAVTSIPESINQIFANIADSVKNIGKSAAMSLKANAFVKIAIAIGVIALALYGLSTIDENKLTQAGAIMIFVMLILKKIVDGLGDKALIDIHKNSENADKSVISIRDSTFKLMNDFAATLIGIGILVAAVGYAVSSVAKAGDAKHIWTAAGAIGAILIGLFGIMIAIAFIIKAITKNEDGKIDSAQVKALGVVMLSIGAAMMLIGTVAKSLAKSIVVLATAQKLGADIQTAANIVAMLLIALIIFVGALAVATGWITKAKPESLTRLGTTMLMLSGVMSGVAFAIGALVIPVLSLAGAIKAFGAGGDKIIWEAAGLVGAIMLALTALIVGLSVGLHILSKNGTDISTLGQILMQIAGAMFIISAAMLVLTIPIMQLATLSALGGATWKAFGIVTITMTILVGLLAGFTALLTLFDSSEFNSIAKVLLALGATMLLIGVAMNTIMTAVITLATLMINETMAANITKSMLYLGLMMGALMLVSALSARIDTNGGIVKVALAMLIFAAALWVFTPAMMAFVGMTAALTVMIKDMEKFGETIGKLALLGAALILFGVACFAVGAGVALLGTGFMFLGIGALLLTSAMSKLIDVFPAFIDSMIAAGDKLESLDFNKVFMIVIALTAISVAIALVVKSLADLVKAKHGDIGTFFKKLGTGVAAGVKSLGESMKTKLGEVLTQIGPIFTKYFPVIMKTIGALLILAGLYLIGFIPSAVNLIGRAIVTLLESLYQVMSENKGALEHAIFGIVATILEIATDAVDWAAGILLPYILKSIIDGVAGMLQSVGLGGAADFLYEKANEWFDPERLRENFKAQSANNHAWFTGIVPEAEEWHDFVANETTPAILSGLSDAKDAALNDVKEGAGTIADVLQSEEMLEKYTDSGETIGSTTADAANAELVEQMPGTAAYAVDGFVSGITSSDSIAKIESAADLMFSTFKNKYMVVSETHSPSRVFMRLGEFIPAGLALGVENNVEPAIQSVVGLSDLMFAAIEGVMAKVGVLADDEFDISPRITPVVDMSNVDSASSYMNGTFGQNYSVSAQMSSSLNRRMADVERAASDMNARGDQIYNGDVVTVNVYPAQGQSSEEIADAVISKISNRTTRRGVAFG